MRPDHGRNPENPLASRTRIFASAQNREDPPVSPEYLGQFISDVFIWSSQLIQLLP